MLHHGSILFSEGYASAASAERNGKVGPPLVGEGSLSPSAITCLDMASSGQLLAVGLYNGCISFYRVGFSASTRLRAELLLTMAPAPASTDKALQAAVTSLSFSPCLRFLAVGTIKGAVSVIDMRADGGASDRGVTGQCFQLLYTHHEHQNSPITALCLSLIHI